MRPALNLVGEDCVYFFFPEVVITKGLLFGKERCVWGVSDTILESQAVFSAEKKDWSIHIFQSKIASRGFALITARNDFLGHSQIRRRGRPLLNLGSCKSSKGTSSGFLGVELVLAQLNPCL